MKKAEFAKSVNLDEVAHNEPPHPDLHCFPASLDVDHILLRLCQNYGLL